MKGIQGLIVAIVLGLVGLAFNWYYLSKSRDFAHVSFIGVKKSASIRRGTPLSKSHLEKISIPKEYVGNLRRYALVWSDIDAIAGRKAIRDYEEGGLLLRNDFRTAPNELRLIGGETAISVPIDPRTTNTSQIVPGETRVSFYMPIQQLKRPTPTSEENKRWIGPFEVLAVGNRMGSTDIIDSRVSRNNNENRVTLKATNETGRDIKGMPQLMEFLNASKFKPLRLKIHAPADEGR